MTNFRSPLPSVTIAGAIDDKGRFPGLTKLFGEGGTPKLLVIFGYEKSSISSLIMIPVDGDRNMAP